MPTQLDTTPDVQPLASFRDNPTELIRQLKATGRPIALTVDGKPEVVLQDPAEYEHMLDLLEAADVRDAIRIGLEDVEAGRVRPAEEFFEEMRQKYGIPR
jgi:prevent-host-death family protein